jgi:hypothetical protein
MTIEQATQHRADAITKKVTCDECGKAMVLTLYVPQECDCESEGLGKAKHVLKLMHLSYNKRGKFKPGPLEDFDE